MSKQFRFYLLPADIEFVMAGLRSKFSLEVLREYSSTIRPELLSSPLEKDVSGNGSSRVRCYLAAEDREIKLDYKPWLAQWSQ